MTLWVRVADGMGGSCSKYGGVLYCLAVLLYSFVLWMKYFVLFSDYNALVLCLRSGHSASIGRTFRW